MVSSYTLSNEARGYNLPPVQQSGLYIDQGLKIGGFSQDFGATSNMTEAERMEEPASQRKRIAVACGRCRQRKIRCSGDNGAGEACTNCKNAGVDVCQFLRVSSQEVQGVRPVGLSYGPGASRKMTSRHSAVSPTLSSSSAFPHPTLAAVGHDETTGQHDMPYGCAQKHYGHVHGWTQGYDGEHCVDYNPAQSSLSMNDPMYLMGSYRSGHPMMLRSNSVMYMDADNPYGYGSGSTTPSLDARTTSTSESSHSFQHGMPCYSSPSMDTSGRIMSLASDRSRSGSSTDGSTDRRASHLPSGIDPNMVDVNSSYHGYDGGVCGSASMDRGSNGMYTTASQDELLVHGSLRSMPDYAYRYTETPSERGGQNAGGMMSMEDASYFAQSRGCYVGGNGLASANNGRE